MKKLLPAAAVIAFIVVFCMHGTVSAFEGGVALYLAQQTDESAEKQSETPRDEVLEEPEAEKDDEYDDEDEYADEEELELIPDPFVEMNRGLYHFNDKMYFWLLKPVARGYGFIIPEELRLAIRNVFYNIRFQ